MPVLLVVARGDRLVPYRNARRLAASLERRPQWIEGRRRGHDGLLRAALADGRLQAFVRASAGAAR
jgi:homoserine acetyltransferase